ncbi:MAG TPA: alpha/beta hydrolase, partial [Acinetobacter sp.]|nr:alpha/beta hydrolase [Acinetobacter sp.]
MPFYSMPDGEQLFVREYGQGQPVLVLSGLGMLSWQ